MRPLLAPLLLGALLSASPALAAAPTIAGGSVAISGDDFTIDQKAHQATFTGHVVVTQAKMTLNADQVTAHYGEAGTSSIQSFEATGGVRIVTSELTATGDRAVYDPATRLLHLSGNVVVSGQSGRVKSGELVVDLKKNTSSFSGGKGGRVTGVFTTQ